MKNDYRAILSKVIEKQRMAPDHRHLCPRCGKLRFNGNIHQNAMSRSWPLYICDICGNLEALEDSGKIKKVPLEKWWAVCDSYGLQATEINKQFEENENFINTILKTKNGFDRKNRESADNNDLEFTKEQLNRRDTIDNSVYSCILDLAEKTEEEFPWNISLIADVTAAIKKVLLAEGIRVRNPGFIEDDDGNRVYSEYDED